MSEEKTKLFVLPESLSIENISAIFLEIKKLDQKSTLIIDFKSVKNIDSSAIALFNYLKRRHKDVSFKNISPGFQNLLSMFPLAVQELDKAVKRKGMIKRRIRSITDHIAGVKDQWKTFLVLFADEIYYTLQYLGSRRGVYPGEIMNQLFFMGYKSFPIVSLISFLVGLTISVTSLEQLKNFGADIYLADLVGFGMIRELVPLMTGIILAGKIGASITAEISSMKVMEETDALKTMGIIPEKFLMVPRLIGITLAVPLLVCIADFVGILAGVMVAQVLSGILPKVFFNEMFNVVKIGDFFIGMMKTVVFGWLVVVCSGYKGFSVKQGAAGVGIATTESVVLSISSIIVFDCIFAFLLY